MYSKLSCSYFKIIKLLKFLQHKKLQKDILYCYDVLVQYNMEIELKKF